MFPYLDLFGFQIPMYGITIAVGIGLALLMVLFRARKTSIKREDIVFTATFAVIGLIVGGKILYLITVIPYFVEYPNLLFSGEIWLALMQGGFVFYGGLIGAVLMILWYVKMYKIPALLMFDTLAPAIPLAHAFGRLGCLCAGCCFGIPVEWGLELNFSPTAPHGVKLMPVQLFEAGGNLVLMAVLLLLERKFKGRRGLMTGGYLLGYAVLRFVLEFFRYDAERGGFWGLSTSQWISILLIPVAVIIILRGPKKTEKEEIAEISE